MKICVVTGTRADYGLLYYPLKEIQKSAKLELQLIATGSHLSRKFGLTYKKILEDGFTIKQKVKLPLKSNKESDICNSVSVAIKKLSKSYQKLKPDLLLILGDRYEILAATEAAMLSNIPIAHIAGGDITEGAIDESIRHAITKMSHIHFVTNKDALKRVKLMGENPEHIYNVGSPGIDMIKNMQYLSRDDFFKKISFAPKKKNCIVTYHPTTINEDEFIEKEIDIILSTLAKLPQDHGFIITGANSDLKGEIFNKKIIEFVRKKENMKFFMSLGQELYLNSLKHCDCVIGNSSSGLYEAPSFNIPTVNIGDRQKGRICAKSVFNCDLDNSDIYNTITKALKSKLTNIVNPYGAGDSAKKITKILTDIKEPKDLLRKKFYIKND